MGFSYDDGLEAVKHLQQRQSVRSYQNRPIEDELLEHILNVGLHGASGGNIQPFTIIVERDTERKQKLCDVCGKQQFSALAPVNLILLLDWHKMEVYAKHSKAPFVAGRSYKHFLTGVEDAMCAIQSIESAAWLCGIGSCYLFSSNYAGREIKELYNLPKHTFPILLMSMGYIDNLSVKKPKLPRNLMVCDGEYNISDNDIIDGISEIYGHRLLKLPADKEALDTVLDKFKVALETTFDPDEIQNILAEVVELGYLNDAQRRFGMHYHAKNIYDAGRDVLEMLSEQDLVPWEAIK